MSGFTQIEFANLANWAEQTGVWVSALLLFVLVIRRPFARAFGARAAYALWALPALRLVMPQITLPAWLNPNPSQVSNFQIPSDSYLPFEYAEAQTSGLSGLDVAISATLIIWVLGIFVYLYLQWRAHRQFHNDLLANSETGSASLKSEAARLAKTLGLKRKFELRQSAISQGPLVTGLLSPIIVVPKTFEQTLTPAQQRLALSHELAHIARRDLWSALAALIFRAVNWPNPLVHMAVKYFRLDQEAACDATVLMLTKSEPHAYAHTLLACAKSHTKSLSPTSSRPVPALGLTLTHPLKDRIMFLNRNASPLSRLGLMASSALIMGGTVISVPVTYAEAHPETELAGADHSAKKEGHTTRSVMRVVTDNGDGPREHKFDIRTKDDALTAYKIDAETGKMRKINPRDIEGFDAREIKKGGGSFQITDEGNLKFLDAKDFKQWTKANPDRAPSMPPIPSKAPDVTSDTRVMTITLEGDDLEGLNGLDGLAAMLESEVGNLEWLENLEKLKALKSLDVLKDMGLKDESSIVIKRLDRDGTAWIGGNEERYSITIDADSAEAMTRKSESLIKAARDMVAQAEASAQTRDMSYDAQQKLKAARKALEQAQSALEDN